MTTANAESGQIRPANKPGRGRLQHTAFVVAMGAQPIGLLEVDAKLRWRGVRWLSRIPRGRGAERHRAHRRGRDQFVPTSGVVQRHTDTQLRPKSTARWLGQPFKGALGTRRSGILAPQVENILRRGRMPFALAHCAWGSSTLGH